MRKLLLLAQISLDGYVSGSDGTFDHFIGGEENLEFVCGITDHADAALLGRKSYALLDAGWPGAAERPGATPNEIKYSNWYNKVPKYVVSGSMQQAGSANSVFINQNIAAEIQRIKSQEGKDILLFGSPSIAQFLLEQNLLDGCWILLHPVMFGNGTPLFKPMPAPLKLKLVQTHQLTTGVLALRYDINT
jgi:dihydrofolate reductase